MTSGDIKNLEDCRIMEVTCGATVAKGDLVHLESDGYWDPCTTDDLGPFGVAIEAAATGETSTFRMVKWGEVEVDCSGAVVKGALGRPGTSGTVKVQAYTSDNSGNIDAGNKIAGTFMESAADLGTATFFVGLVG